MPERWRDALAVALAALAFQMPIFDRWMSLMDEGHILQFAEIVREGGELYRDAVLYPLPGAFYLLAAASAVFGPSNLLARWMVVIEFALLCAVAFALLRRFVSRRGAWLGVGVLFLYRIWAFPHWQMYSYSTLSLLLLALALLALFRFLEDGRPGAAVLSGLLAGLAVFVKQDYGGAGLLALNAVLLVRRVTATDPEERRLGPFLWLTGAAAAVGAATALHFLRQGLLLEMVQQTVWNHLVGISRFEYTSLPPLWPLFSQDASLRDPTGLMVYAPQIVFTADWGAVANSALYRATSLWDLAVKGFFYAPYAIAVGAGWRIARRRAAFRDPGRRVGALQELGLYALGTALFLSLSKPVDYVHVVVLYWPYLCLLVVQGASALRGRPRLARVALAASLLPGLLATGYTVRLMANLRAQHDVPLAGERAGIRVRPGEARVVGDAVAWLREHSAPDEAVAVLPYFPLISFLADRGVPERSSSVLWPVADDPQREAKIVAALQSPASADVALVHFTEWVHFPRMRDYAPELYAHLADAYRMERAFGEVGWSYLFAGLRRETPSADARRLDGDGAASVRLEGPGPGARPLTGREREQVFRRDVWPFRRVWALRPLASGRRGVVSVPVEVPPGAHLRTAVGVHPDRWFQVRPASVTFRVLVAEGGRSQEVFRHTLDPHRDPADRGWFDVDVPLEDWAGRSVAIEFTAEAESPLGEVLEMGGWGEPALVVPDARGGS